MGSIMNEWEERSSDQKQALLKLDSGLLRRNIFSIFIWFSRLIKYDEGWLGSPQMHFFLLEIKGGFFLEREEEKKSKKTRWKRGAGDNRIHVKPWPHYITAHSLQKPNHSFKVWAKSKQMV